MISKKFLATFIVATMIISSMFVLVVGEGDDSKASNPESIKTLDEIKAAAPNTYWVIVNVNEETGVYELSTASGTDCVVEINHNATIASNDHSKLTDGRGFIVDEGFSLTLTDNGGGGDEYKLEGNGYIECKGTLEYIGTFQLYDESHITVKKNGSIKNPNQQPLTQFYCNHDNGVIILSLEMWIAPVEGDFTLSMNTNADYDATVKSVGNDVYKGNIGGSGKLLFDCFFYEINSDAENFTMYLREGGTFFVAGAAYSRTTFLPDKNGKITVVDKDNKVGLVIDQNGKTTENDLLTLNVSSGGICCESIYIIGEKGATVNLIEGFGVKAIDGYKITGWVSISSTPETRTEIKDPTNYTVDGACEINVYAEYVQPLPDLPAEKDNTMLIFGLYIIALAAIIFIPVTIIYGMNRKN